MVGGLQIKISGQAERAENHERGKRENFTETVSLIWGNENKRGNKTESTEPFTGRYQGWKGVRKAASMRHLL